MNKPNQPHSTIIKKRAEDRVIHFVIEINAETDRGAVLFAAAFFDDKLKQIINIYFGVDYISKMVKSFGERIDFCFQFKLINGQERSELHRIKDIRNIFAHKFEYNFSFDDPGVCQLCKKFESPIHESYKDDSKRLFINAAIIIHNNLISREKVADVYKLKYETIPLPRNLKE